MSITSSRQLVELKGFFEAVSDGIAESDRDLRVEAAVDIEIPADFDWQDLEVPLTVNELMVHVEPPSTPAAPATVQPEWDERPLLLLENVTAEVLQARAPDKPSAVPAESPPTDWLASIRAVLTEELRLHFNATQAPQLELERAAKAKNQAQQEDAARRYEELELAFRQSESAIKQEYALRYEAQLAAECAHRIKAEERGVELEMKLVEDEAERRSLEIDLRDHTESLSVLRSELGHLSERKQQLEWESTQLKASMEQHENQAARDGANLEALSQESARQTAFLDTREQDLLQLRAELGIAQVQCQTMQQDIDSLRIEFGRKLEERRRESDETRGREADLKAQLAEFKARLHSELAEHSQQLEVLTRDLAAERDQAELKEAELESLRKQQAATKQLSAAPSQPRDAFLAALPQAPSAALVQQAAALPEPAPINLPPVLEAAPAERIARPSAEQIERERNRLQVLALGTERAPAKLYFQAIPWDGLATPAALAIAASEAGAESNTLTAFVVGLATRQAVDASNSLERTATP